MASVAQRCAETTIEPWHSVVRRGSFRREKKKATGDARLWLPILGRGELSQQVREHNAVIGKELEVFALVAHLLFVR